MADRDVRGQKAVGSETKETLMIRYNIQIREIGAVISRIMCDDLFVFIFSSKSTN